MRKKVVLLVSAMLILITVSVYATVTPETSNNLYDQISCYDCYDCYGFDVYLLSERLNAQLPEGATLVAFAIFDSEELYHSARYEIREIVKTYVETGVMDTHAMVVVRTDDGVFETTASSITQSSWCFFGCPERLWVMLFLDFSVGANRPSSIPVRDTPNGICWYSGNLLPQSAWNHMGKIRVEYAGSIWHN